MVVIVEAERPVENKRLEIKAKKLIDIVKQTFPDCTVEDSIMEVFIGDTGFDVVFSSDELKHLSFPPKTYFDVRCYLHVEPIDNSITVYDRKFLNHAVRLARIYEDFERKNASKDTAEFKVIERYGI